MHPSARISIQDPSQVGEGRRKLQALAADLGFDETQAGRLAIAVTEAGNNLVKHARGGWIVYRPLGMAGRDGIEVLVLDRGPGMANLAQCLEDGYSTSGTSGTGLGAIRRLSSVFDIHSHPGAGTAILFQVPPRSGAAVTAHGSQGGNGFSVGGVCMPMPGETLCGDSWDCGFHGGCASVLLADGLGHGAAASDAARSAQDAFRDLSGAAPMESLKAIHAALRSTRGAAVGIASVDPGAGVVRFSGLGNVACVVFDELGRHKHLVSHNGTAGIAAGRMSEFTQPWRSGGALLMHTDGIGTRWDVSAYPGLLQRHPSLIAGVLYRDFARGTDDASVVVVKERER